MRIQGINEDEGERKGRKKDDECGAVAARGEEKATGLTLSHVATADSASSICIYSVHLLHLMGIQELIECVPCLIDLRFKSSNIKHLSY
jgi:hypothetical protein